MAYFSMDEENPLIKKLGKEGRIVAVYENGYITIKKAIGKYVLKKPRIFRLR